MTTTMQPPRRTKEPQRPGPRRSVPPRTAIVALVVTAMLGIAVVLVVRGSGPQPAVATGAVDTAAATGASRADQPGSATANDIQPSEASAAAGATTDRATADGAEGTADGANGDAEAAAPDGKPTRLTKAQLRTLPRQVRQRIRQRQRMERGGDPTPRTAPGERQAPSRPPKRSALASAQPGPPAERGPNSLQVSDQTTDGTRIRLDALRTDVGHAFVTVHAGGPAGSGRLIGFKAVTAGTYDQMTVPLDKPLSKSAQVFVALHRDTLEPGAYRDGQDPPVVGESGPIRRPVTVSVR